MRWTENLRGLRAQEVSRLAESQKYREQRSLVRWFIRINSRKYNASRIKWNGPGPIINSGSCNDRLICNAISRRVSRQFSKAISPFKQRPVSGSKSFSILDSFRSFYILFLFLLRNKSNVGVRQTLKNMSPTTNTMKIFDEILLLRCV